VDLDGRLADGYAEVKDLLLRVVGAGAESGGLGDGGDGQRVDVGFERRGVESGSLGVGGQVRVKGEAGCGQAAGGDKLSARDQKRISKRERVAARRERVAARGRYPKCE
jgi:hypothetical protein